MVLNLISQKNFKQNYNELTYQKQDFLKLIHLNNDKSLISNFILMNFIILLFFLVS